MPSKYLKRAIKRRQLRKFREATEKSLESEPILDKTTYLSDNKSLVRSIQKIEVEGKIFPIIKYSIVEDNNHEI